MTRSVTLQQPRLTVLHVIRRAVMKLIYIQVWDQAASMTFFLLLSIAPLLISLVSIINLLGLEESVLRGIVDLVSVLFPPVDPGALTDALHSLNPDGGTVAGAVLGFIGTLIAASNSVAAFHRSMHRIYDTREGRQFLPFRTIVFFETLALLVAVAAAALLITVGGDMAAALGQALNFDETVVAAWSLLRWPLLLFVLVVYVNVAYHRGPNVELPRFGIMSAGSLVSVGALFAMAVLLGWLSSLAGTVDALLGTLNGVTILLVLAWFASIVLIAGAALDAELLRARQLAIGLRAWDRIDLRPRNRWTLDFLREDHRMAGKLGRIVADSALDDLPRRLPRSLWLTEADSPFAVTGTPAMQERLREAADEERAREESPEADESSAQAFRVALVHSWDELRGATSRAVHRGGSTAVGALQHQLDRRRRGAEAGSAAEASPREQPSGGSSSAAEPEDDDAPAAAEGQGPGRRG